VTWPFLAKGESVSEALTRMGDPFAANPGRREIADLLGGVRDTFGGESLRFFQDRDRERATPL
jgi:hypothetical protein